MLPDELEAPSGTTRSKGGLILSRGRWTSRPARRRPPWSSGTSSATWRTRATTRAGTGALTSSGTWGARSAPIRRDDAQRLDGRILHLRRDARRRRDPVGLQELPVGLRGQPGAGIGHGARGPRPCASAGRSSKGRPRPPGRRRVSGLLEIGEDREPECRALARRGSRPRSSRP
jgi:hypothetical protein